MLSLILFIVLTVVFVILAWIVYNHDYDGWPAIFAALGGLSATVVVFICISLIGINAEFEVTKAKYENVKYEVDRYNMSYESDKIDAITLRQSVLDMNNTISQHKILSENPWHSLWYSEEIGNLEKLVVYNM